jgi:DNA mismatch repair protein MutS2
MTLFVEPYEIREKANQRIRLIAEIESLILKLTIELSKVVHKYAQQFNLISSWALEIDWINTKATYSLKKKLHKPMLNSHFQFEINGLFHPLIDNPIKNDFTLTSKHKGMIISGPNTGGKTVALKSFAICLLFTHLGLYVPSSHAEIDPIAELYYFSHDHQSLSQGLSSFASEAKYYLQLLDSLSSKNIIIIDEIFNSTSSEEASALAISFLDEVHFKSQSKIILSTHHQVLKTYMHSRNDYMSAHVGYDFELNRPTYKLILGEPGSSLAFKIFENLSYKFNIPNSIGHNAKNLLDQKQVTYESLLQELSSKKVELDKLLLTNKNLNLELRNQKASMEGTLYLERERILSDYNKKIKQIFSQAENLFEQVKEGNVQSRKNFEKEKFLINKEMNSQLEKPTKPHHHEETYAHLHPVSFDEIEVNGTYFSLDFRKNVKVLSVNPRKKEVQIKHGVVSLWVSTSSLRYSSGPKPQGASVKINIDKSTRGDIEVDCRGMRLEEFQKTCLVSIDEVVTGEIPFVTIIHGHGDGILKSWLRSHLKKEHSDLFWENIEGNDGCTKISLKE